MQYLVDHNFQRIAETEGTLQNVGTAPVEIATEKTEHSGLILQPTQIISFKHASIYVRSDSKCMGVVATVPIEIAGSIDPEEIDTSESLSDQDIDTLFPDSP